MKMRKRWLWFLVSPVVILALVFGWAFNASAVKKASYSAQKSRNALPENTLLQFTTGGHILGFKPDRAYFASLDHTIIEEFVGTKGVMPAGEAGKGDTEGMKGAPPLGKVVYKDLWQGITLKYEAVHSGIAESTFALEPETDVKKIKLRYNVSVDIQKDGSLRFRHPSEKGYFSQSAPKAWQEMDGKRIPVEVAFADYGDNTIGFTLGEYNNHYPVVIDPTYQWHTFYGSASSDAGYGIAVDTGGNVYVTGRSNATWNGPAAQSPLNAYSGSGNGDIVVLKLNTGGAYQWHTFYGSANDDNGYGIAVDAGGNVYVTGGSFATWGTPLNAYSGDYDIVVLKLNTSGAYQWHTFYGYAASDEGYGIAVDAGGNVYVTGWSFATWNGPAAQAPLNAYSGSGNADIVVLKLNTSGAYQWHTFYGSAASDWGDGIAVDAGGNVYVTGWSDATWNGPAAQSPLNAYSDYSDIVVLELNTSGAYQWHTFYGSVEDGDDNGNGIAVDTGGNVYVTGESDATWNGPVAQAPLNAHSGSADIVVLKFAADVAPPTPSPSPTPTVEPTSTYVPTPTPVVSPSPIPSPTESPTAVSLVSFKAKVNGAGSVTLAWETASEVDNAGFNIYRSKMTDGTYKKVNGKLIPAEGNGAYGASYSFEDTPGRGTFYYKLEDVDYNGTSAVHGPVKVRVRSAEGEAKRRRR